MGDNKQRWDELDSRFRTTGKMTQADRLFVLNSCPTCCDSGMDEGKFCEDCNKGRQLARQAFGN